MPRSVNAVASRARRKKILNRTKGYWGRGKNVWTVAKNKWEKGQQYAYRDRRQNKRNFRKLWITRINAACRENEISYSKFINGLNKAGIVINRKMLSELAIDNKEAFADLVVIAKDCLNGKAYAPKTVEAKEEVKEEKKSAAKKTTTKKETAEKKTTAKKDAE